MSDLRSEEELQEKKLELEGYLQRNIALIKFIDSLEEIENTFKISVDVQGAASVLAEEVYKLDSKIMELVENYPQFKDEVKLSLSEWAIFTRAGKTE